MAHIIDPMTRLEQVRAFKAELIQLAQEGITLEPALLDRIRAHHGALLADTPDERLSLGMRIASLVGAIALSAAIFFLFYRFWGGIPTAGQVTLLILVPVLLVLLTDRLHRWEKSGYFAALAALAACAAFILDLTAIGDIYNLPPSPHAFLAWGAFGLLIGIAYDLRLPHLAGLVCLATWLTSLPGVLTGQALPDAWDRPEAIALTGAAFLGVSWYRGEKLAPWRSLDLRIVGMCALFLGLLILGASGRESWLPFDRDIIEVLYQLIGFLVAAGVTWWGIRDRAPALVNGGVTFFVLLCLLKAFDWWWDLMPRWAFFLLLSAIAIGVMVALKRIRPRFTGRLP
jgi:uncharacterized membrane protein